MVKQAQDTVTSTRIEELVRADVDHLWHPFTPGKGYSSSMPASIIAEATGATIKDITGKEYIDGFAGLWTVNVGHGRKEIQQAIIDQMQKLEYFSLFRFSNVPSIELAAKLAKILPGDVNKVFMTLSGSESIDTALKIARQYWKNVGKGGKFKIISRKLAYHGTAFGGTSVQGLAGNRQKFEPLVPGVSHVAAPYCYRCEFGKEPVTCGLECAWDLQHEIDLHGKETVAAFIGEAIVGTAGVMIPPDGYWQTIRKICDDNEVLLIVDEVITGFGRTGKMFYAEHTGVVPDMMTMAKGLSSGYLPMGATAARDTVYEAFMGPAGSEFASGCTYDGHPLCCAAAIANIDIIINENLPERSRVMGDVLAKKLEKLYDHEIVGDIRCGRGLIAGIELVKDKKTREAFPAGMGVNGMVNKEAYDMGLFVRPVVGGATVAVAPPLVISEEQIDSMVNILDKAIGNVEKQLKA